MITEEVTVEVAPEEINFSDGEAATTELEAQAVEDYVSDESLLLDPSDVLVAAVEASDDADIVVVAPKDEVEIDSITVDIESEDQELTLGAETTVAEDQLVTSGPGMGAWPAWNDVTLYQVQLDSYWNGHHLGYGRFSTKFRNRTNADGVRQYQYSRSARAQPASSYPVTGPDYKIHAKKLWISNQLTAATQGGAGQWDDGLTKPLASKSACASDGAAIGPWGVAMSNCEDTDVWQGAVGHMRVSMDQGQVTKGGSRSIAYVAGYTMKKGTPANTYYQFVTFRIGDNIPGVGIVAGSDKKCADDGRGKTGTTERLYCHH